MARVQSQVVEGVVAFDIPILFGASLPRPPPSEACIPLSLIFNEGLLGPPAGSQAQGQTAPALRAAAPGLRIRSTQQAYHHRGSVVPGSYYIPSHLE